jgi:hypothetical protein
LNSKYKFAMTSSYLSFIIFKLPSISAKISNPK